MLDLKFFTPGTTEADEAAVKKLYDKIYHCFWDNGIVNKETILYMENKRQFRILIGEGDSRDLHLEIEVETVYENKEEDKKKCT